MQGLIFDIKHYAIHDGPGIRQTIFFKGCPLSCWWCHNPESQNPEIEYYTKERQIDGKTISKKEAVGYEITSGSLLKTIQGDTAFFDESGGGVTFSGGEPLMQPDFLKEIASGCKAAHIHTALDTSGYITQDRLIELLPYIDLVLFDLKIIDDDLHRKYTGVSNKTILDNLRFLDDAEQEVWLRFPIIPGITNTNRNLEEISAFLQRLKHINRIDILSYHDISRGKYKRFNKELKMTETTLGEGEENRIRSTFENLGFTVKIGG